MLESLMQIGDVVLINIPAKNRHSGHQPCPNGTEAKIVSFAQIAYGRINNYGHKPGIYANRMYANLELLDGRILHEFCGWLDLKDQNEYKRRLQGYKSAGSKKDYISNLPDTPFWEGDLVKINPSAALVNQRVLKKDTQIQIYQVVKINYEYLNQRSRTGVLYPAYTISTGLDHTWHKEVAEDALTLVERGQIWQYYNGIPLSFEGISQEAAFFVRLGHTNEVRNPATNTFIWSRSEVRTAVQSGIAHGQINVPSGVSDSSILVSAIRFRDEQLGKRVAIATLDTGFTITV